MKIPRYINSNRRTINQFVGINQQRIPAALLLDFGSDVFETRRNDHRRNSRRHQLFDNGGHMAVPYNLVEVGVNFFFFKYAATTEIYTLSLHDALRDAACAGPLV